MFLTKEQDSEVKIIDFGLAADCSAAPYSCKTPCGTAHYAAPEVLSASEYDQSADMWSLGVIVYVMLCGFPPFFDDSDNMKVKYSFPSPAWDDISEQAKELIAQLLQKDPKLRPSAEEVQEHQWSVNRVTAPDKDC